MGFRFRKSVKIAPGVRLNLGKKSAGISFGGKGAGVSINSKTGTTSRVSIPGTGLSYTSSSSSHKHHARETGATFASPNQRENGKGKWLLLFIVFVYLAAAVLMTIMEWFIFAAICIVLSILFGLITYKKFSASEPEE